MPKRIFILFLIVTLWEVPRILAETVSSFSGKWKTSFGIMNLEEKDGIVTGSYRFRGVDATISGAREGNQLAFTYEEPNVSGLGEFTLAPGGQSFSGRWQRDGDENWWPWIGEKISDKIRDFSGLWNTSFGQMRVIQTGKKARGTYAYRGSHGLLDGNISEGKWNFSYAEPDGSKGNGSFTLINDGFALEGKWKTTDAPRWFPWSGTRILPKPGLTWLVVIEARWEENLIEREYAFGDMLEEFFDRVPNVQVRHRFFANEQAFLRWCQEIAYIAEPVVVSIASHGTTKGLDVGGKTISPQAIANAFRWGADLRLLHFSSCEIMRGNAPKIIRESLPQNQRFPISGYASTVDWASSAVLEFAYFDMILSQGLTPTNAADQLLKLMPFAGDRKVPGTQVKPAKFRFQGP